MNYTKMKAVAEQAIRQVGMPIVFYRDELKLGSGYGVFVEDDAKDNAAKSAQTTRRTRTLYASAVKNKVQVGDRINADKTDYLIMSIKELRPTTVTMYLELEVA